MARAKNNFTYIVGLEGGVEEGPLTLTDLQPLLRNGKVVGSTFIKRSDRAEWSTAADLPELKVKDDVGGKDLFAPDAVTQEIEKELYQRKVRSGVSWLFWIAALSLLNSGLAVLGIGRAFTMGLGAAHLIAGLGDYVGSSGVWVSLGANVTLSLAYLIVGVLAWHGRPWLLGPAIAVYIADGILCALFDLWLTAGIHVWALCFLIPGFIASYGARGLEFKPRVWVALGAAAAVLSAAGFGGVKFLLHVATPDPTSWASSAPAQWPQMSVAQAANFKGHTPLAAGNAFFIRCRSGKIVAATARHLLGPAGGVDPIVDLSGLDSAILEWTLNSRATPARSARVRGLLGSEQNYRLLPEWVLLQLAPEDIAKLPAEPLAARLTVLKKGETVYVVGSGAAGTTQEIHPAKVVQEGWTITAEFEKPVDLVGYSGAPVIDANGNLVAMLTSSRAKPDKQGRFPSFTADSVLQVRNLLR